jgi:hypothetical protein
MLRIAPMPELKLKRQGDLFGQDYPDQIHLAEVRTFRAEDGRTCFVHRYPRRDGKYSYHAFVEVEDRAAYKLYRGGNVEKSNPGWWDEWPEK